MCIMKVSYVDFIWAIMRENAMASYWDPCVWIAWYFVYDHMIGLQKKTRRNQNFFDVRGLHN